MSGAILQTQKTRRKRIEIRLSGPFKEVLVTLLTLPRTATEAEEIRLPGSAVSRVRENGNCDAEVKEAFRSLYEAAHGRQVETSVGFIAIAPPVAGFLNDKPYYVATQYEFFLEVFARILAGSPPREDRANSGWTRSGKTNVPTGRPRRGNRTVPLPLNCDKIREQPALIRYG